MAKRVVKLSDLREAGPPSEYPVDVPQGGTWALWRIIVAIIVLLVAPIYVVAGVR